MQSTNEREADLRALAKRLQFAVEQSRGRFTLTRTADVSRPVREENLSLAETEQLLEPGDCAGCRAG